MVGLLAMLVTMLASVSQSFRLGRVDWQKSVLPGEGCPKKCHPERCPDLRQMQGCPGGLVRDQCGCCWECGNKEGQLCDPQPRSGSTLYGRCAEGLLCRTSRKNAGGEPRAICECSKQEALCGSDGKTYNNVCQFRAAKHKQGKGQMLTMVHHGPGWFQIQAVGPSDAGVYTCTARNAFGEVSASARLQVTHGGMSTVEADRFLYPTISAYHLLISKGELGLPRIGRS